MINAFHLTLLFTINFMADFGNQWNKYWKLQSCWHLKLGDLSNDKWGFTSVSSGSIRSPQSFPG